MSRRIGAPGTKEHDWFLVDWMDALGIKQAELARRCGWSRGTTNDIYHGRTDYYRKILNEVAAVLDLRPYELLLPPKDALAIRHLTAAAHTIVRSDQVSSSPPS